MTFWDALEELLKKMFKKNRPPKKSETKIEYPKRRPPYPPRHNFKPVTEDYQTRGSTASWYSVTLAPTGRPVKKR